VADELLEQAAASDGIERQGLVLAGLTRLKQVCNHPAHYLADGTDLARPLRQVGPLRGAD